eukprot:gb/GECG01013424.1/.p1 GENE.gb/GECG01013424.1/~~gb/GECG01013424.1/.p1  ORF type:complete len:345 (+),score=8.76 gb/GECG01013424.1/:1-1035(+)
MPDAQYAHFSTTSLELRTGPIPLAMPLFGPEFLAGMLSGAGTRCLIAPLDMIKIRLQLNREDGKKGTIRTTIRDIYQEEGIKTFWRGNMAATTLYIAYGGVQFGVYNASGPYITRIFNSLDQQQASSQKPHSNSPEHFVRGALASLAATLVTYPFDWSRTRFAAQGIPRVHKTTFSMMRHEIGKYGPLIVFDGCFPTLLSTVPSMAITVSSTIWQSPASRQLLMDSTYAQFTAYEWLRSALSAVYGTQTNWMNGVAGALAGLLAKATTYPLDTTKKRLQTNRMEHAKYFGPFPRYSSLANCLTIMLREEGIRGFYRGFTPSLVKVIPSTSISFMLYEFTLKLVT